MLNSWIYFETAGNCGFFLYIQPQIKPSAKLSEVFFF